jgi:hypothetical protein
MCLPGGVERCEVVDLVDVPSSSFCCATNVKWLRALPACRRQYLLIVA